MDRRLYRSSSNKVIAGVCGGLGEHFDIDPTLMRLIAVVAALASFGIALVFYLLAWIVIPQQLPGEIAQHESDLSSPTSALSDNRLKSYLPGLILVGLGAILLLREYVYWFRLSDLWPVLLVLLGLFLVLRNGRSSGRHSGKRSISVSGSGSGNPAGYFRVHQESPR